MSRPRPTINRLTALFLVLLRVAIGWHLCYEGLTKIQSHRSGTKPFSAEGYLRNATGPFREHFRGLVDDIDGNGKLDDGPVTESWSRMVDRYADHYGFDAEQRGSAKRMLAELSNKLYAYLYDDLTTRKVTAYRTDLVAAREKEESALPEFEQATLRTTLRELDAKRKELTGPVVEWTEELRTGLQGLANQSQIGLGAPAPSWNEMTQMQQIDLVTMYGLFVFGACMILGLFSRLSALGAAVLLALFYFSMPPWPGLPVNPKAEGSYLIVNKNLIEMIACLMLATTPSGIWGGIDALIRGFFTRPLFGIGKRELIDPSERPGERGT